MEHWLALEGIIEATGEPLEGNCVYENQSFQQSPLLASKRRNYAKAAAGARRICEIGFNAGHSAMEFLHASPGSTYVFFDLGEHAYTRPCADYIEAVFQIQNMD